jgi:VWFA-related protein
VKRYTSVPAFLSVLGRPFVGGSPGSDEVFNRCQSREHAGYVRDKKGQIVHNLTKDDFSIEEDGRPQIIGYFSQETDLPLTLGLLVDTSLSQRNVLGQERTASFRFFDQVLRPDKDKAFVIHFDHEVELLKDLTSSKKELDAALSQLETPQLEGRQQGGGGGGYPGGGGGRGGGRRGGGTLLYDAVLLASDDIMKKQQGRKAVILLTDGVDRGSKTSLPGAIEAAQRANTAVYSILFADHEGSERGFGGPGMGRHGGYGGGGRRYPQQQRPDGKKILEQISKETGGGFFEVSKKQPIEQIYDHIQEELRSQYSLGYTPDKAEAGYHKITVTVKEKGLVVQARDGYYAGG